MAPSQWWAESLKRQPSASNTKPDVSSMASDLTDKLKQSGIDMERLKSEAQDPAKQKEAEQAAREAGDKSAQVASRAALFAFFALLFGAAAGAFGGSMGRPHDAL